MFEQKQYQKIFSNWRLFDNLITLFAMVGLVMAIVEFELDIRCMRDSEQCRKIEGNSGIDAMKSYRFNERQNKILRTIIFVLDLMAITCLFMR